MQDLLREENFRLGISSSGDEEFICSHDAWRSYPRIIFCLERLTKLNRMTRSSFQKFSRR
jgi:hypothetical protein